jgi:hypothetical protein
MGRARAKHFARMAEAPGLSDDKADCRVSLTKATPTAVQQRAWRELWARLLRTEALPAAKNPPPEAPAPGSKPQATDDPPGLVLAGDGSISDRPLVHRVS